MHKKGVMGCGSIELSVDGKLELMEKEYSVLLDNKIRKDIFLNR